MANKYKGFTPQEISFIGKFRKEAEWAETRQVTDLITNCHNKYQFAKTFKVYEEDWLNTRRQMEAQAEEGSGLRKEVLWEMIYIGDKIMREKQSRLSQYFQTVWQESIFNYVGGRPTLQSILKEMGSEVTEKEPTVRPLNFEKNRWPLVLSLLAFFILVLLPVLSHQLSK